MHFNHTSTGYHGPARAHVRSTHLTSCSYAFSTCLTRSAAFPLRFSISRQQVGIPGGGVIEIVAPKIYDAGSNTPVRLPLPPAWGSSIGSATAAMYDECLIAAAADGC